MRIFEKPNTDNDWKCPVCQRSTEAPVTLIGIKGERNAGTIKAKQVHVECLDLEWQEEQSAVRAAITQVIY